MCILSGSFGDGHDAAAREIQRRLAARGIEATILDIVDCYPLGLGRALKRFYLWQVKTIPQTWGWFLGGLSPRVSRGARAGGFLPGGGWARTLAIRAVGSAARRLRHLPETHSALVSTHPFASQVIGQLAAQGRTGQPPTAQTHTAQTRTVTYLTYLTDLSVHALWVNPHVDEHLALHDVTAAEARALGARSTTVVAPAIKSVAAPAASLDAVPRPTGACTLVAVTGGAEGVGDLEATARDLLAVPGTIPVVLCGRNDALRKRLSEIPGVIALGWVTNMAGLYASVDAVVQNAGGSTSLEALAAGLPVVSYRCLPGHGETNAANLARTGLIPWAGTPAELQTWLLGTRATRFPAPLPDAPCVGDVLADTLGIPSVSEPLAG